MMANDGGSGPDAADSFGYRVVDLPPAAGSSPEAAVRFLVAELVASGLLRPEHADGIVSQVLAREALGSTALGGGIALPHSKSDAVGEMLAIVGRSATPVTWPGALGAAPVRIVCLLVSPASRPAALLRALHALSRRMRGA